MDQLKVLMGSVQSDLASAQSYLTGAAANIGLKPIDLCVGLAIVLGAATIWTTGLFFIARRVEPSTERIALFAMSGLQRTRSWLLGWRKWSYDYSDAEPSPVPPVVHRAEHRGASLTSPAVLKALGDLLQPSGPDAVILRDAVKVPNRWRFNTRSKLRDEHADAAHWIHRASKQVMCYLASAHYMPLLHCYDERHPKFAFRAKAFEERQGGTDPTWPHRLFESPATVMPHLPFGPALFGKQAALEGTLAPDVVAFIMMESRSSFWRWQRRELGPRLYFLDQLEAALDQNTLKSLRRREFKISPDSTSGLRNVFGQVEQVNVFGQRDHSKYMRFDLNARTSVRAGAPDQNDLSAALNFLIAIFLKLQDKEPSTRLDLRPGDVLIVNNWRVATQWDQKCKTWNGFTTRAEPGDRLVYQMNFYYPSQLIVLNMPAGEISSDTSVAARSDTVVEPLDIKAIQPEEREAA